MPLPDQMNLLQSTWLDIICFNEAFRSVPYEGSIVFADDFKCSEAESKKFGIPSTLDSVSRKLAQKMTKMAVTTEEYVLLKTILLLNPGMDFVCRLYRVAQKVDTFLQKAPCSARASPFLLRPSLPRLLLFLLCPFLSGFNYFLLLSILFLSTGIGPLRFQAGGRRKRPNLGLVCCV